MKPVVIVGTGLLAELAWHALTRHAGRHIDAFAVDPAFLDKERFCDRPVMALEAAMQAFAPATHDLFIAIGHTQTGARRSHFLAARARGYRMASVVHPSAVVEPELAIGENVMVQPGAIVAPFAHLGENVMLQAGCIVSHHAQVGSHSFIAPGALICGDARIGEGCFIGAQATVRDRVRIGDGCVIGMGALIVGDCPPGGVYRAGVTRRTREIQAPKPP